jgi:hypothetical protein
MKDDLEDLRRYFQYHNIISNTGRLNAHRDKYLKADPGLNEKYQDYVSLFREPREAFYCLSHWIKHNERPVCPVCGKLAKFIGKRYNKTCGECNYQALPETLEKTRAVMTPEKIAEGIAKARKTCIERYGTPTVNQFLNEQTKLTYKKRCQDKYSVDNVSQLDSVKRKRRETCKKRYGVECNLELNSEGRSKQIWIDQHDKIIEKCRQTSLNKYGVESPTKATEVQLKIQKTKQQNITLFEQKNNCTSFQKLINKYGQGWKHLLDENKLTIIENTTGFGKYISNDDIPKIEKYASSPHNIFSVSGLEKEVREFVVSIYKYEVLFNKRNIISDDKGVMELDIFIPEKKVAIEINGIYWHSTNFVDNNFHLRKTIAAEKLGIRLIHIFEDEWRYKQEICKSVIASALGIYQNAYFARKCIAKRIAQKMYTDFLNRTHFQGTVNSKLRYGLFYNGELIQVIGIGHSRFSRDKFELHRMCTKLFSRVVGGFSKLLKFAEKDIKKLHNMDHFQLISFVDRAKFNGNGYETTGFEYMGAVKQSYYYIRPNEFQRKNRMAFQKHKLASLLENYDPNLSERENVLNNGYLCVYDCGNKKYKLTL